MVPEMIRVRTILAAAFAILAAVGFGYLLGSARRPHTPPQPGTLPGGPPTIPQASKTRSRPSWTLTGGQGVTIGRRHHE